MSYITIDSRLRVGEKAILDGDRLNTVTVKWIGQIFALVMNPVTRTEWSVMANRLKAPDNDEAPICPNCGFRFTQDDIDAEWTYCPSCYYGRQGAGWNR